MKLIEKAQIFIEQLFEEKLPKELVYHNYNYTEEVVQAVKEISEHSNLVGEELEIVLLAAWFHATGYIHNYDNYIEESQKVARDFLKSKRVSPKKIERVVKCIHSLEKIQLPETEAERILSDAILYPLSQEDFFENAQTLRKEKELMHQFVQTDLEWFESQMKFLIGSNFQTKYGKDVLENRKAKELKSLKKKMKKHQAALDISMEKELGVSPAELKELKKKLLKVEGRPERGIETMFRLTSKNHLTLSGMADTKANIMISVNSIILSILIGSLMQKLDNNPQLIIPTYVMLIVNLGSIIFSILSTRPNITIGKFTRQDIENNKTNLLFFGNFHKMQRPDYQWGMQRLMDDGKFLYSSLIDDIFFLGVVLGRKYKFLRIAYNIFMYGLVLAVISFMISNAVYKPA
jgi:predicted metal-dependent HD superfamily phosphohydrolase